MTRHKRTGVLHRGVIHGVVICLGLSREEAALGDHVSSTQSDRSVYSRDYGVSSEGNDQNGVDVETRYLLLRFLYADSPVLASDDEDEL